jgi:hypothetical protein
LGKSEKCRLTIGYCNVGEVWDHPYQKFVSPCGIISASDKILFDFAH